MIEKLIREAIEAEISKGLSANKLATKIKVNAATISKIRKDNWENISVEMKHKIQMALGIVVNWVVSEKVTNYRVIKSELDETREESYFTMLSEIAGSGKTASLQHYANALKHDAVYYIQADDWSKGMFMDKLIETLGIDLAEGRKKRRSYVKVDEKQQAVINYFERRTTQKPLLIIDEADKLRPSALRFTIPLFNRLEDKIGVFISGTENLEKQIRQGVRLHKKGYDEIESRFGRTYKDLMGATKSDIVEIARVNGLEDELIIDKIWTELEKVNTTVEIKGKEHNISVVKDFRRLKRLVKTERKKLTKQAA